MKEKFIQIPQALRKQIWLRCGGAGMGAAMLLMVLIYSTDWRFMGIVVLCLTQFFVHGAELEKDVDGLL